MKLLRSRMCFFILQTTFICFIKSKSKGDFGITVEDVQPQYFGVQTAWRKARDRE